ncbi:MAG: hypothetical protein Kow00120_24640 [Anaerolineae bacterium]
MQETRQHILEILKEAGQATVDELVAELRNRTGDITAVTVRYHLDILRSEGLVDASNVRRRRSPGRPQYIYALTEEAEAYFPKNYQSLADHLLGELKEKYPAAEVRDLIRAVAQRMAAEVGALPDDLDPEARLEQIAAFLTEKGYRASWEPVDGEGGTYLLHISNCPYHSVAGKHCELCLMDTELINLLTSDSSAATSHIANGADTCTYETHLSDEFH